MDLQLISGKFLTAEIPKEKIYLKYYFEGIAEKFIIYCCAFPKMLEKSPTLIHQCFVDHTGIRCSSKSIERYIQRYNNLEKKIKQASDQCDLELLYQLKNGQFPIKNINAT